MQALAEKTTRVKDLPERTLRGRVRIGAHRFRKWLGRDRTDTREKLTEGCLVKIKNPPDPHRVAIRYGCHRIVEFDDEENAVMRFYERKDDGWRFCVVDVSTYMDDEGRTFIKDLHILAREYPHIRELIRRNPGLQILHSFQIERPDYMLVFSENEGFTKLEQQVTVKSSVIGTLYPSLRITTSEMSEEEKHAFRVHVAREALSRPEVADLIRRNREIQLEIGAEPTGFLQLGEELIYIRKTQEELIFMKTQEKISVGLYTERGNLVFTKRAEVYGMHIEHYEPNGERSSGLIRKFTNGEWLPVAQSGFDQMRYTYFVRELERAAQTLPQVARVISENQELQTTNADKCPPGYDPWTVERRVEIR